MERNETETLEALGLTEAASPHDVLKVIEARAESARTAGDPEILALNGRAAGNAVRERPDYRLLRDDAAEIAEQDERDKQINYGRAVQREAEAGLRLLRDQLTASMARQRVLTGEADQPAGSRTEKLLGKMLDVLAEREADEWIDKRTAAEVWLRYEAAADDGPERSFVRTVERRHAARLLRFDASDPLKQASHCAKGVAARQEARVRDTDRRLLERLNALAVDLERSGARLAKDPREEAGRLLAIAGQRGTDRRAAVQ